MSPSPLRRHAPAGFLLAILLAGGCGPGVLEPVEMRISVIEGNHQVDSVTAVLPTPLRVQVQDQRNRPMPGVEVRWQGYPDGGAFSSATSLTDAQGIAAVTYSLGPRMGSYYVAATGPEVTGSPAWFEVKATPGAAAHIRQSIGGDALGVPGTTLAPYGVYVTDAHGNHITDATVDWVVTEGGGSVFPTQSTTTNIYATTRHTLGPQDGRQTVLAVASGLPGMPQVAFTATAVTALVSLRIQASPWDCYYYDICSSDFIPAAVTINPGQTVGWTWSNSGPCDVVFEDDPTPPASSLRRSGGIHLRTFTVPGLYRYRCTLHSSDFLTGMVGAVVVE